MPGDEPSEQEMLVQSPIDNILPSNKVQETNNNGQKETDLAMNTLLNTFRNASNRQEGVNITNERESTSKKVSISFENEDNDTSDKETSQGVDWLTEGCGEGDNIDELDYDEHNTNDTSNIIGSEGDVGEFQESNEGSTHESDKIWTNQGDSTFEGIEEVLKESEQLEYHIDQAARKSPA